MTPDHSMLKGGTGHHNGAVNFSILDQVNALVVVLDPGGRIVYANPAFERMMGTPVEGIAGRPFSEFISNPKEFDGVKNLFAHSRAGRLPDVHETIWQTKKNGSRLITWSNRAVMDNGSVRYVISTGTDVTNTKAAAEKLKQTEARNQALIDALPDLIFQLNRDGIFVGCNAPDEEELLLPASDFLGKHVREVLPVPLADETMAALERVIETGELQFYEYSLPMPQGVRHYETRMTLCGENELIAIIRNVTELKRREHNLHRRDAILDGINYAAGKFLEDLKWERNIPDVLKRLGEATEASRVYIFANSIQPDGTLVTSQRFEWAAPNIQPELSNPTMQGVPYSTAGYERLAASLSSGEMFSASVNDFTAAEQELFGEQEIQSILLMPVFCSGEWWGFIGFDDCLAERDWTPAEKEALAAAAHLIGTAIERSRDSEVLRATLSIAEAAHSAVSLDELYLLIHKAISELMPAQSFYIALYDEEVDLVMFPYFVDEFDDIPSPQKPGKGLTDYVLRTGKPLLASPEVYEDLLAAGEVISIGQPSIDWLGVPLITQNCTFGVLVVQSYTPGVRYKESHKRILEFVSNQVAMAIERKRREQELEAIVAVAAALRAAPSRDDMVPVILDRLLGLMKAQACALLSTDNGPTSLIVELGRGSWSFLTGAALSDGQPISEQAMNSGCPLQFWSPSGQPDPEGIQPFGGLPAAACIPLIAQGISMGVIWVGRASRFAEDELSILSAVADMAANGIYRATLHEQTQRRLQRLGALRSVDMAISASLDLRVALNVLLDQLTVQLNVDATDVLLYNHFARALEYAAGRGFMTPGVNSTRLRLGEGLAGKAALERHTLIIHKLEESAPEFLRSRGMEAESFISYYAVPLVAKGQLKGLLEIYHRSQLSPDREWTDFLETMGGQAAIAIDNATLFNDLQRSNMELALAYDTTLVGWVRALDLRDQETEGHTQRVIDMTLRLARTVGKSEGDLVNVRRGVLLHDIGKIAIPDSILLKPGPLDEKEWEIMRRHPDYAYELLSPISYLRKAIDIPYCHHEKWDGSGYPRGLKGEQIPLAARIFAVVDVWDALRSRRPYREGWEEDKVREYILAQKGKHFDPEIVDLFMNLLEDTLY